MSRNNFGNFGLLLPQRYKFVVVDYSQGDLDAMNFSDSSYGSVQVQVIIKDDYSVTYFKTVCAFDRLMEGMGSCLGDCGW